MPHDLNRLAKAFVRGAARSYAAQAALQNMPPDVLRERVFRIARAGRAGLDTSASIDDPARRAEDLPTLRSFYSDVVGLKIADEADGAVFMSSDPEREHHEFAVFQARDGQQSCVQQLSFSCENLQDIINYYHRFKEHG